MPKRIVAVIICLILAIPAIRPVFAACSGGNGGTNPSNTVTNTGSCPGGIDAGNGNTVSGDGCSAACKREMLVPK